METKILYEQSSPETEIYQLLMKGDEKLIAEAEEILKTAREEQILPSDTKRAEKSKMLVALALFYISRPKDERFSKIGEALFWAYKLDAMNEELWNVFDQLGCSRVYDKNHLQERALAWAKRQEKEDEFWNLLLTMQGPKDLTLPSPSKSEKLETQEEADFYCLKFIEECMKEDLEKGTKDLQMKK